MARQVSRGLAGGGRRVLTWILRLTLVLAMAIAAGVLYLRWAGAPNWLRQRLESELRARGFSLQIQELHLQGLQLLARNLSLRETHVTSGPTATVAELAVRLDGAALKRGHIQAASVVLRGGQMVWPLRETNAARPQLSLEKVALALHLRSSNQWELQRFDARLLGAELHATASLTNAPAIREWFPKPTLGRPEIDWRTRLEQVVEYLSRCTCAEPSVLNLNLRADGRDPRTLQIKAELDAGAAGWPGGASENVRALFSVLPSAGANDESEARLQVAMGALSLRGTHGSGLQFSSHALGSVSPRTLRELTWDLQAAEFRALNVTGRTLVASGQTVPGAEPQTLRSTLALKGEEINTRWGSAITNEFDLTLLHGWSSAQAWKADWRLKSGPTRSIWGQTAQAQLSGRVAPRAGANPTAVSNAAWGFWAQLEPYELQWQAEVQQVQTPKVEVQSASAAGRWSAPAVSLDTLRAELYGGQAQASARLDVATCDVQGQVAIDFDVHRVSSLLTTNSQHWLKQYAWQVPPKVSSELRVRLPAWTNRQPRWRDEVMPTLQLAGEFTGTDARFRGMPVAYARSHFTLSNMVWHLPDLFLKRPDSEATLVYTGDMRSHEFRWHIDGRLDPRALEPLVKGEEAVSRVLNQFEFTAVPSVQGDVRGHWHQLESLGCNGRISATNFMFRGELCTELAAGLQLTNSTVQFTDLIIKQGPQQITVPHGSFDLSERVIYVTNAISTMDPDLVTRVIGPKVRAALRPYKFMKPPTVRASGRLPTFDIEDADVRFEVEGEDFRYWKLRVPSISGDVHWYGDNLTITNVQASFYGGQLVWWGHFDFSVPVGAQLSFAAGVKDADMHAVMGDLGLKTNNLQGSLDGELHIAGADSDDWRSWQGSGRIELRNGFLWGIPIFGFFSPVLNTLAPGLGNSSISAGHATFTIDQSVVHTSDLELKSPALRLDYSGSVDFQGKVDARMQAAILRDAWGVGRVLSVMLWPISKAFAYRITGTVYHPKSEPVYIPGPLFHLLHPFKTARKALGLSPSPSQKPSAADHILSAPDEEP